MLDMLRNFALQVWANVVQVWQRLSLSARVNIGLTLAATIILIAVVVALGSRKEFVDLYTGLDPKEVDQIRAILADEGIPYKMADNYTTIRVPDTTVGRARVKLQQEDLPTHHGEMAGWELLDEESLWISPEKHQDNVRRAVQGELQKMLNQFDFVDHSFVFISQAEQSLIASRQMPSEAAITLDVNRNPTRMEIDAILGTVATFGGVTLDRSHITLATTDGDLLHSPVQDDMARVASTKHGIIEQWEKQREQKILDAFNKLGRKAIVKVSAKLDFSSEEVLEEAVTEGVEYSTLENKSELTSKESLPEGPPGAFANMPEGVPGPTETETVEKTEETVTNMEPSRKRVRRTSEPGDVLEYKVSAIIDWGYHPKMDENGEPTGDFEYQPLTDEEKEQFRQTIAHAVGPEVGLEDVYVFDQPFQIEQMQQARAAFASLEWAARWSQVWGIAANGLKIALVIGIFLYLRHKLIQIITPEEEMEEEISIEAPGPTAEELRRKEIAQEVETFSQQQPEAVAALLRSWISESEE